MVRKYRKHAAKVGFAFDHICDTPYATRSSLVATGEIPSEDFLACSSAEIVDESGESGFSAVLQHTHILEFSFGEGVG